MAAIAHPTGAVKWEFAENRSWSPDSGELLTREYRGEASAVLTEYYGEKTAAGLNTGPAQVEYSAARGRAVCVARFAPSAKTTEEIYAVDMVQDIRTHTYFSTMTNAQMVVVQERADKYRDADSGWTDLQKQLHYHLVHGTVSYYETNFILRRSTTSARTQEVRASFTGINTVVTPPTLSAGMSQLLDTLPSGEWLKKPPQAQYLGRGRWQVDQSWHWAPKWSKIYGGTWGL
jgi:hypothetical protein